MFIDTAKINIKAGNGGNGSVSFHRKVCGRGRPDGGDGGRGGNVVFVADSNLSTLMDFRYKRKYAAQNGEDGRAARCSGKNAPDLIIRAPRHAGARRAERPCHRGYFRRRARGGGPRRRAAAGATCILPRPRARSRNLRSPAERARSWRCVWAEADCGRGPGGLSERGQEHHHFLSFSAAKPKSPTTISPLFHPVLECGARRAEASFVAADIQASSKAWPTALAWARLCAMWTAAACFCMWWTFRQRRA